MHFGLSFEQEMIVDTVRSFVENEIYPHEAEVERTGEVPLSWDMKFATSASKRVISPPISLTNSAVAD